MAEPMSAAEPAIVLAGVGKRYGGRDVLRDVSLALPRGECLGLLGHNGAGKTTMIKLMLGLTRPSAGTVSVLGLDPLGAGSVHLRQMVGFLPESVSFHDAMTGREVLTFYARLKGVDETACARLLDRVGLSEAASRRVRTYSKGMRQRLGLAQALLGAPRLLLLDEPTTGLDPGLRLDFFRILADLRRDGVGVLISSHALSEIEPRLDRLAILREGRLVAHGSVEELRHRSGLPVRVRIWTRSGQARALARDLGDGHSFQGVNDSLVDLTCVAGDKMELMRRIATVETPVQDVDIRPPGLEEIYAHFTADGDRS